MFTNVLAELTNQVKERKSSPALPILRFLLHAVNIFPSKLCVTYLCDDTHVEVGGHPARSLLISNCDPQLKSCHSKQRAPP